jgi:DNA-binding MarR family transcriptional regulator
MSRRKRRDRPATDELVAIYDLIEAPGHLLRRCQQRAVEIFVEEVGPGLTPRQFAILVAIAQRPGLTQTELVTSTGVDRSTVGDMVTRLVRRGFIRRRRSGRDQRANTLVVLPAGVQAVRKALPAVERTQQRILEPLPPAARAAFVVALRAIAESSIKDTPPADASRESDDT